jgi:hypothetical protein
MIRRDGRDRVFILLRQNKDKANFSIRPVPSDWLAMGAARRAV